MQVRPQPSPILARLVRRSLAMLAHDWEEGKHPRDDGGKFGAGGGGGKLKPGTHASIAKMLESAESSIEYHKAVINEPDDPRSNPEQMKRYKELSRQELAKHEATKASILKNFGAQDSAGDWEEGKHPRADNGQFGSGGGGASAVGTKPVAPFTAPMPASAAAKLPTLVAKGRPPSKPDAPGGGPSESAAAPGASPASAAAAAGKPQSVLTTPEKAIEDRMADQLGLTQVGTDDKGRSIYKSTDKAKYRAAVEKYATLKDAEGGKVLNTDVARELSPDYLGDRTQAAAVHEPSSQFIKDRYAEMLAQPPGPGEDPMVLFTAGGTGAGKSTAINNIGEVSDLKQRAQIVYDTNLNTYSSGKKKIEQALAAGKRVNIAMVVRDPEDALVNGAFPRAEGQIKKFGSGRTVPMHEHVNTHIGALDVVKRLAAEYADHEDVHFRIIDNTLGKGGASERDLAWLHQVAYNNVEQRVNNAREREYEAGRISKATYRGFSGGKDAQLEPSARSQGSPRRGEQTVRARHGESPQPQARREEVGRGSARARTARVAMDAWNESDHPRAEGGQFGSGGGGAAAKPGAKPGTPYHQAAAHAETLSKNARSPEQHAATAQAHQTAIGHLEQQQFVGRNAALQKHRAAIAHHREQHGKGLQARYETVASQAHAQSKNARTARQHAEAALSHHAALEQLGRAQFVGKQAAGQEHRAKIAHHEAAHEALAKEEAATYARNRKESDRQAHDAQTPARRAMSAWCAMDRMPQELARLALDAWADEAPPLRSIDLDRGFQVLRDHGLIAADGWVESDHVRADNGQFESGGGQGEMFAPGEKPAAKAKPKAKAAPKPAAKAPDDDFDEEWESASELATAEVGAGKKPHPLDESTANLDRIREKLAGHEASGNKLADFYRKSVLPAHEDSHAKLKAAFAAFEEYGHGTELSSTDGKRHAVLLPDASEQGRYRYQRFDENGFSGHHTEDTPEAAIADAASQGYFVANPGILDKLASTSKWAHGMAINAIIQANSSGLIDWKTANEQLAALPGLAKDTGAFILTRRAINRWSGAADEEHWITINGGEGKGTPLKITDGGVVVGGAGGNLNGKVLSPKSKSEGIEAKKSAAAENSPDAQEAKRIRTSEKEMRAAGMHEIADRYAKMAEAHEDRMKESGGDAPKKAETVAKALQNRNRSSAASITQMNRIANNPNPRLLMSAPTMNDGAPVVSDLGGKGIAKHTGRRDWVVTGKREIAVRYAIVDAGDLSVSNRADGTKNEDYAKDLTKLTAINNGRTAGVIEAYNRGTADAYKKALAQGERIHGIPAGVIRKMDRPVLVRIMDADDVDSQIGDESNSTMTLALSAVEQAQNDSTRFDPSSIDFNDDGSPTDASVRGFINAMPQAEQQSLSPNGKPTRQAIDRMMAATFHSAYGDTELVGLMAQATDPESRNLINGMSKAAGSMAKLKDAGELDIRELVTGAAKQIINAVRSGVSIKKFLKQGDLLTTSGEDSIAALFAENSRSAKAIGEKLNAAAEFAYSESKRGGIDMFGETIPTASRESVLEHLNA